MSRLEQFALKNRGDLLYNEREAFIRDNYPGKKSHYQMSELLNSGLDGMEVIEKRNKKGEIIGMISYDINKDHENIPYLSVGIILTSEESRGEGIIGELFSELKKIAKNSNCEYIAAIADTEEGKNFLLENGFSEEKDEVNGREYFRLDL